jgi:hypothetical protein
MVKIALQTLCSLLFLVASTTQASPDILNFDVFDPIKFEHGTIVNTQHSGSEHGGVTLSAENGSQRPDLALAFDSRPPNTEDSDFGASIWLFITALLGFVGFSRRTSL